MNINRLCTSMFILLACCALCPLACAQQQVHGELLPNNDFEQTADNNQAKHWTLTGNSRIQSVTVHTGESALQCMRTGKNDPTARARSIILPVNGGDLVSLSGWVKTENVVTGKKFWDQAQIALIFYANGKRLKHKDIFRQNGTRDWTLVKATYAIPREADWVVVECSVSGLGKAWFDGLSLKITKDKPGSLELLARTSGQKNISTGFVVFPTPKQATVSSRQTPVKALRLHLPTDLPSNRLDRELKEIAGELGIGCSCTLNPMDASLILGIFGRGIQKHLARLGNHTPVKDANPQGYCIAIRNGRGAIGAFNEHGLHYGLMTLRQLFRKDNGAVSLPDATITDWPDFPNRGLVFGSHTFRHKRKLWLDYIRRLRGNTVLYYGSFVRACMREAARPFTEKDLQDLREGYEDARHSFVEPWVAVNPAWDTKTPLQYSSPKWIDLITRKYEQMAAIGYRNFVMGFDDLGRAKRKELFYPEDKRRFTSMGEAQVFFINKVHEKLKAKHADIRFMVTPTSYFKRSVVQQWDTVYCQAIKKLPREIPFIWCGLHPGPPRWGIFSSDTEDFCKKMGGRRVVYWSNCYADNRDVLIPPMYEVDSGLDRYSDTYLTLPYFGSPIPTRLYVGLEFAWNTRNFKPEATLVEATRRCAGNGSFKTVTATAQAMKAFELMPQGDTRQKRIDYYNRALANLQNQRARLKTGFPALADVIKDDADRIVQRIRYAKNLLQTRPFPLPVGNLQPEPVIDGSITDQEWGQAIKLTDFRNYRKGDPASPQTEVRIAIHEKKLCISVRSIEPRPAAIKREIKTRDGPVWQDDSIEIFLEPEPGKGYYYHVAFNAAGVIYDSRNTYSGNPPKMSSADKTWNGNWQVAARVTGRAWELECAIPLTELTPTATTYWRFNIGRERRAGSKGISAYVPTFGSPGFPQNILML